MKADLTSIKAGRLQVHMHPGQARAIRSKARHILVLAGTQSGKTSFGPLWLYREIQLKGPGDYLVVAPAFPLLELKLRPEFMRLFDSQLKLGSYTGSPTKKFTFSEAGARKTFGDRYDPDVPTQIFFGHAQDPDSLESATAKAAWLDEAGQRKFKKSSHEAIMRRLAIHQGRVLYTTTPYYIGWLKKELHDKADGLHIELINFRSIDNPAFSKAEYDEQKKSMPAWKHTMFYDGLFTRPAGLIYDCFRWELHTCEPFPIPDEWPRVFGLDFGGINTACLKLAYSAETDCWYAYHEYKPGMTRTAADHVAELKAGEPATGIRAVGGAPSELDYRIEYTTAGLKVLAPDIKEVEVGIDRAYALLKEGKVKFFTTCTHLLGQLHPEEGKPESQGELETYSRVVDEEGQPTEAIQDKSKYHMLDAFRYAATLISPTPKKGGKFFGLAV